MGKTDKVIFNREIERRLSDPEWSRCLAAAVIAKNDTTHKDKVWRAVSWIVPALTAAVLLIVIGTCFLTPAGHQVSIAADQYDVFADLTESGRSEIDYMIEYVYYGRE